MPRCFRRHPEREGSSRALRRAAAAGPCEPPPDGCDGVYNLLDPIMEAVPVQLDQDLVELLEELQRPARQAARELIVLELYRQSEVSSGRAAQLLGMEREEFIRYASKQGIPYFQLEGDELQRELDAIKKL
jgi:predicted HTH domain antitoxin